MADDRDALIATLTEEGWEPNAHGSGVLTAPNGWHLVPPTSTARLTSPVGVVNASFSSSCPSAVILAAARAAVEAEGGDR